MLLQELSGEPLAVEKEGQHVLIGERITDIGCGGDEDEVSNILFAMSLFCFIEHIGHSLLVCAS